MNLRRHLSHPIVALIFSLLLLLPAPTVSAAGSKLDFNITTSPIYTVLNTKPGNTTSTNLRVQNNAASTVELKVSLMKFKPYGNQGQAQIYQPAATDASVDWVHFSRTTFIAQPGQWNDITMTVNVPRTAAFGYYYAVVFGEAHAKAEAGTAYNGSTTILVLLNAEVPGAKRKLSIKSFGTTHRMYEYLPTTFNVDVKNEGNTFAAPGGDIYVDRGTRALATIDINPGQGNILPGSDRLFQVTWNDGFPKPVTKRIGGQIVSGKDGKPVITKDWGLGNLGNLRIGKYTAHLALVYNNGSVDVPLEDKVSFWVIPWRLLLVTVLIAAVLVVGAFVSGKRLWGSKQVVQERLHQRRNRRS